MHGDWSYRKISALAEEETKKRQAYQKIVLEEKQSKARASKEEKAKLLRMFTRDKEAIEEALAKKQWLLPSASPRSPEELPSLVVSKEDASPVVTDVTPETAETEEEEAERKADKEFLRNYQSTLTNYRQNSWTIDIVDRERCRGDLLLFIVIRNGQPGGQAFQGSDIYEWIDQALKIDHSLCFYLKSAFGPTKKKDKHQSMQSFGADFIYRALYAILERADTKPDIVIPNKRMLRELRAARRRRYRQKGFAAWFRPIPMPYYL